MLPQMKEWSPYVLRSHLVKNSGHGRSGTVAHGQGSSTYTGVSPSDRRQPSLAQLRASAGRHLYQYPAKERYHVDAGHRVVAVVAGWQSLPTMAVGGAHGSTPGSFHSMISSPSSTRRNIGVTSRPTRPLIVCRSSRSASTSRCTEMDATL